MKILRNLTKLQWLGVTCIVTSIALYVPRFLSEAIFPKAAFIEAHTVRIESHMGGVIQDVFFEENHLVMSGDKVAGLDTDAFASRMREVHIKGLDAKAKINYADADIALLETRVQSISSEHKMVTSMLEQAKLEREEAEDRFTSGEINQNELYTYAKTQVNLEREALSLSNMTAEIIAQQEKVEMSKGEAYAQGLLMVAQMNSLTLETKKLSISTPVNGVISSIYVSSGQYVKEGDVIADVVDTSEIWVTAYVDESDIESVAIGSLASVKINYKDEWLPAVVQSVSPVTESKRVGWIPFERSVVPVKLAVKLNSYIQPGVEVDVMIIPSEKSLITNIGTAKSESAGAKTQHTI